MIRRIAGDVKGAAQPPQIRLAALNHGRPLLDLTYVSAAERWKPSFSRWSSTTLRKAS